MTSTLHDALARCRGGLWAVFGFSMVVNLLMLTVALYMLQVYDRVLSSHSVQTLIYLTILAVAALALLGLFEFLRSRVLVRLGTWLDGVLSPTVFTRGLDNALAQAPYRTEALRDLATLRNTLGGSGINALFDSPWVPIYILVIYLLHPSLGHIALAGAVILFALALVNHLMTHARLAEANAAATRALRGAESAYRNAEVIDGMGLAPALARRWADNNSQVLALQAEASDHAGTLAAMTKSFRLMLQVGILGAGGYLVLQAQLTPGGMIAASIILGRALAPVEQAIGAWKQMVAARAAWGRLTELLDAPPRRPEAIALPRPKGRLTVEGVGYAPPGAQRPVLMGVSLEAKPGEVLALVGPSAAGKSTLARLLVGMAAPQAGKVRLDGADVFAWDRADFGQHVGYLPQDVELFPGSVRDNISRMTDGLDDDVVAAAQLAGCHEMILRLANGYQTEIGEGGAILSGGQRQRIALARAIYGDPVLVVLDEPNASLDSDGEEALNGAIAALKEQGVSVVLIAHRPSLMAHVDRVAVLNEGRLQHYGERDQVLAQLRPPPKRPVVVKPAEATS